MSERLFGKIAAILDTTTVVINRGSRDGVERGDEFYIYSQVGPFRDPDTGENLGETTRVWDKVIVAQVEERFCIARTDYGGLLASVPGFFRGPRVRLPVAESDITRSVEKIRVGFQVVRERVTRAEIAEEDQPALPDGTASDADESAEESTTEVA